jgi:hypothetical protein
MSDVAAARQRLRDAQTVLDRAKQVFDQTSTRTASAWEDYQNALKAAEGSAAYIADGIRYPTKAAFVAARKARYDELVRERKARSNEYDAAASAVAKAKTELAAAEQQEQRDQTTITQNRDQQGGRKDSAGTVVSNAARARDQGALTQNPPADDFGDLDQDPELNQATNAENPLADEDFDIDTPVPATVGTSAAGPAGGAGPVATQSGRNWYALGDANSGPNYASLNYIYKAVTCIASFRGGQFTMNLEGRLMSFPKDELVKKNNPNAETQPRNSDAQNNAAGGAPNQGQRVTPPDSTPGGGSAAPVSKGPSQRLGPRGGTSNLQPQRTAPPTSNGQPVGVPSNAAPRIQVQRINGGVQTVSSEAELDSLFKQGQITQSTLNSGKQQLAAKQSSASTVNTQPRQSVVGDGG